MYVSVPKNLLAQDTYSYGLQIEFWICSFGKDSADVKYIEESRKCMNLSEIPVIKVSRTEM